jgi:hypothetical protein
LLLAQVPPGVIWLNTFGVPIQTVKEEPVMGGVVAVIVTIFVIQHPVDKVYEMVAVPAETPVNSPVAVLMVAIAGVLVLQVPPATTSVYTTGVPEQVVDGPIMGPGAVMTETSLVALHPAIQYEIVVVPNAFPVTLPDAAPTEATTGLLLIQ